MRTKILRGRELACVVCTIRKEPKAIWFVFLTFQKPTYEVKYTIYKRRDLIRKELEWFKKKAKRGKKFERSTWIFKGRSSLQKNEVGNWVKLKLVIIIKSFHTFGLLA